MPESNLPLASPDRQWDGPQARQRMLNNCRNEEGEISRSCADRGFAIIRGEGDTVDDYRLPFADLIDGRLHVVRRGVIAALNPQRGVDAVEGVSEQQKEEARRFLERQLERFEMESENSIHIPETATSKPILSSFANLHVNGQLVKEDNWRHQLMAALDSNLIRDVEFDAVTFIQGPNANHFVFDDQDLDSFAESFASRPFLRNHDTSDIGSRDGTIITSRNEKGQFVQTIRLTTKRGIQSLAEGQIDRFSIGWDYDAITCTVCGKNYASFSDCPHVVGQSYDEKVCQVLFENPTGIETSAVNVPAVNGTHILAALEAKKSFVPKTEVLIMDEETTILQEQEQEVFEPELKEQEPKSQGVDPRLNALAKAITPLILAELMKNDELQASFAQAFFLGDIDSRLGEVELALKKITDNQSLLASGIDALNGELLPGTQLYQVKHDDVQFTQWGGYRGSMLSAVSNENVVADEKQPQEVRPARQLQQEAKKVASEKIVTRRQEAGGAVLNLWNNGG